MQFGSVKEVIAQHIHDGQSVALEGFTHLIPFAAGHEILRQGRRDLHLIRMTPDLIYDQLIGAGCARTLTFSWGGNPGSGSLCRNGPGSLMPERYYHGQKNPSLLRSQTGGKHA
jgi:glutaconate CoA-transferase subunit A